jgi:hypothetical protein
MREGKDVGGRTNERMSIYYSTTGDGPRESDAIVPVDAYPVPEWAGVTQTEYHRGRKLDQLLKRAHLCIVNNKRNDLLMMETKLLASDQPDFDA